MSDIVFILGAGASKQAGAPVMANFLDVARDLNRRQSRPHFDQVFKAVAALQMVHSKAQLNFVNIEAVFATFEMARIIDRFCNYKSEEIAPLRDAMKSVIADTIEGTLRFPTQGQRILPPEPYGAFGELLSDVRRSHRRTVSIITFNYDLACDYMLRDVDYGLSARTGNSFPLLKLHGSLNWAFCAACEKVVAWPLLEYLSTRIWDMAGPGWALFDVSRHLREFVHCQGKSPVTAAPVLVPPAWNKSDYHQQISSVWQSAAKELSEAEEIYIVGYSLPETDGFFRTLYALGAVGPRPLERFVVFDPDPNVGKRFQDLLGP